MTVAIPSKLILPSNITLVEQGKECSPFGVSISILANRLLLHSEYASPDAAKARRFRNRAAALPTDYCFPARLEEIADRLARIFLRDAHGQRPVYGGTEKFQTDPHWRDHILFYEYFHGDNGAGLGASHQTGWTALVAPLLDLFGRLDAKTLLETERGHVFARVVTEQVGGEKTEGKEAGAMRYS